MRSSWLVAIAIASWFPAEALADGGSIEIRFCPSVQVRVYPLEGRQEIQSVVLQQAAIINRSTVPLDVTEVDLELLRGGHAVETRRLTLPDLRKRGRIGVVAPPRGATRHSACQFWDGRVIPQGARAALGRGDALFVSRQLLAFQGSRDAMRLRVRARAGGRPVEATRDLPVRMAMSATLFRFPLRGTWWVGAAATPYTHHRWVASEEFALDIGKLGAGGLDHRGSGQRFRDYYAYGEPVLAAADGVVVTAIDGVAEDPRFMRRPAESMEAYARRIRQIQAANVARGPDALIGNHVVIDHGGGEYSLYAHLQPRSVRLKKGTLVREGQPIGKLGSSGNSTGPHLHFQLCDGPDLDCASIPVRFKGIDLPWGDYPRPIQSGDVVIAK